MRITLGIITISDRAATGIRKDESGPALITLFENKENFSVIFTKVIPDEFEQIKSCLIEWCNQGNIDIILTTGGTGFSPRDITPEATLSVIQRSAPGLTEMMRIESFKKNPYAMLSRAIAGIRNSTLIINLPGSPKAAVENLESMLPVLPHAVSLLKLGSIPDTDHEFHKRAVSQ